MASDGRLRILVVEDSATVRHRLLTAFASDPGLDVVAEAADGGAAIELCQRYRPDVITMDMMLPTVSGLAATEHIMAHWPTPILVVSSSTNRLELFDTYDALAAGAVDVLDKPRGDEPDEAWERRLVAAVKLVSRIRVITHPMARLTARAQPRPVTTTRPPVAVPTVLPPTASRVLPATAPEPPGPVRRRPGCDVIAVGASTGGPGAVVGVLRELPPDFPIPVLLVQHISAPFSTAFAEWLGVQLGRDVSHPEEGQLVNDAAGRVLLAPANRHMTVRAGRVHLTDEPERHSCRPSVDVLFESVALAYGDAAAGALLTGMGRDGADGLLCMRRAGALTLAQDKGSSVVYGMPKEAVLLGAAREVLPPDRIGRRLAALAPPRSPMGKP